MMKLLSSPFSPYGRKVRIAVAIKGVQDRIEMQAVDTETPVINRANPLGKIPALVIDEGTAIFDSHVICEYLDSLAPAPLLFPKGGVERIKTLTLASLADGMLDAALLLVYEKRFRPEEKWHAPWQERQQGKIDRALDHLEGKSYRLRPGRRAPTTATSRSPARWATSTCATRANGARSIRRWWLGSRSSPRPSRPSRRRGPRRDAGAAPSVDRVGRLIAHSSDVHAWPPGNASDETVRGTRRLRGL